MPDFGFLAVHPNRPQWIKALKAGVKEEHLLLAQRLREKGVSQETAVKEVMAAGASAAIMPALAGMWGYVQFHDESALSGLLQELKDILPYSVECHCKYHYLDKDFQEASIPYARIFPVLKDSDFNGYLICEYEDELGCGGTEYTKRMFQMEKRLLDL